MRRLCSIALVLAVFGCEPMVGVDAGSGGGGGSVGGGGGTSTGGGGGSTGGGGGATGGGGGATGGGGTTGGGGGTTGGGGGTTGGGGGSTGGGGGSPTDAGARQSCTTATTCAPLDAGLFGCALVNSCIDGLCLPECGSARTCTTHRDAGCMTCDGTSTCGFDGCISPETRSGTIESTTCVQWRDGGVVLGTPLSFAKAGCDYVISHADAGLEGRLFWLQDITEFADVPAFGGACTVSDLPTGLQRSLFSCPQCEFVIAF